MNRKIGFRFVFTGFLITWMSITLSGVIPLTALAHTHVSPNSSCSLYLIGYANTLLRDGHELFADLFGKYDANGYFCGQLDAEALEIAPAHTTAGNLGVILEDCHGNAQTTNSTVAPSGGLNGTSDNVYSGYASLSCGRACTTFYGFDPYPGATQGSVCGSYIIGTLKRRLK